MKLADIICRNCIYSTRSNSPAHATRCFKSPPPRHTQDIDSHDVCGHGKWLVRRKWDDYRYDSPIAMDYTTVIQHCMNDEIEESHFVVVAIY